MARKGLEYLHAPTSKSAAATFERASPRDTMTEEATMHKITATPIPSLDAVVESHRSHQDDATGNATDIAAAHSTTIGLGRHVQARDLHPGDIMQQHDWSLHVREVKIGPAVVAVAVTEFGFELHYSADQLLQVAV
jgi:hypothetical protein